VPIRQITYIHSNVQMQSKTSFAYNPFYFFVTKTVFGYQHELFKEIEREKRRLDEQLSNDKREERLSHRVLPSRREEGERER
jgi:hypothetical protein